MTFQSSEKWIGVGITDIGRVRKLNQDAFSVENALQLWVLADGMGGHAGGEIASQLAVEKIPEYVKSHLTRDSRGNVEIKHLEGVLTQAIEHANDTIRKMASQHSAIRGMGTTVVVVAITRTSKGDNAVIAHAGDSRAYVYRERTLVLWTKDHTLMEERLALNLITPEQVRTHPLRHVLTKALGIDPQVLPSTQVVPLDSTDLILICSDGLTKMMTDSEIQNRVSKEAPHLSQIGQSLITTANRLGGHDNTTVVLIGRDTNDTWIGNPSTTA